MKLNQKLVKQLRNGEISAENDGTFEQLQEVFEAAFPEVYSPMGGYRFYRMNPVLFRTNEWACFDKTNLPIISVTDFYQPEPFTGWAKDDNIPKWMAYFKDGNYKFGFCVFGSWREGGNANYSEDKNNRPATHKEIEKHLIQEAKRRGYKGGNYKCLELPRYTHDVANCFYYNEEENKLHHGKKGCATNVVFKNGQWAEIIEQPSQVKPKDKTNPIHYTVEGNKYSFNYQELKAKYESVVNYSDEQFMSDLPEIAHLACIIATLKGLGTQATIGDKGIIHELIHLMTDPDEPTNNLQEIREKFNRLIKLS